MSEKKRVLCVVGPTACGKTKMGVLLAKQYGGEVVSVDSMQIYRGMTIGSAAPTAEEMEGVPHHMVAVADPAESWSVARFTREADRRVQDILARGKLPVLVGGTGLYLDALIDGRTFAAGQSGGAVRRELEERLAAEGVEPLLSELRQADPEAAARLHPGDEKRIIRALEVWHETGETITDHDARTAALPPRYDAVRLGLTFERRADMWTRIDRRVDEMMDRGLVDEVKGLLHRGVRADCTAMQAIGYKELISALRGERTVTEAAEEIKLRSRQYARRQLTWFRRTPDVKWLTWEETPDFSRALQNSTAYMEESGLV